METLKDKYGNEIESWEGTGMNDAKMIMIVLVVCFIAGLSCGVFTTLGMKPHRAYVKEVTKYVEEDYPFAPSLKKREEKVKYFLNGKEVPYEEYTK